MENNHRFFRNPDCKHFPCHEAVDDRDFNCLFCFCPLYTLGDRCGGRFTFSKNGKKSCVECHLPHMPTYYDVILSVIKQTGSI